MSFLHKKACILLFVTLALCVSASAQTDEGRLSGSVKDGSGAAVSGATITVRNEKTGTERTTSANSQGYYAVTNLPPDSYTVVGKTDSLGPAQYADVKLSVGEERILDLVLQPATVQQVITVSSGELATIDTSSAAIGGNVSEREIAELPINGRQISQLYLMTPGAVNFGAGTFDDMRFNGRSYEENAIRFDGIEAGGIISNNPGDFNGEIPGVFRLQASMENVQEFRIDSNNYPAEFGTGTGGQISIITKSGGNNFHGSLFEYFRNDKLDARNFFDGTRPSILRLNQFGGSVGGADCQRQGLLLRRLRSAKAEDAFTVYRINAERPGARAS